MHIVDLKWDLCVLFLQDKQDDSIADLKLIESLVLHHIHERVVLDVPNSQHGLV
jgi:hypothetical protein